MSFLDEYLDKHRLDKLPGETKKRLEDLQNKMEKDTQDAGDVDFKDCIKQYGPEILDLVDRVSAKIGDIKVGSIGDALDLFRFVKDIALEVSQIVNDISGCIIPDGLTPEEERAAKVSFGQDLTYFIWVTVGPLDSKYNWIPFKKKIEKKLVYWLSGQALEFVYDLFDKNPDITTQSVPVIKKGTFRRMKTSPRRLRTL